MITWVILADVYELVLPHVNLNITIARGNVKHRTIQPLPVSVIILLEISNALREIIIINQESEVSQHRIVRLVLVLQALVLQVVALQVHEPGREEINIRS